MGNATRRSPEAAPDRAGATAPGGRAADRALVRVAAAVTVGVAVVVLLGWALDLPRLRGPLPGAVDMKANTAVGFLLCGMALWLIVSDDRHRSAHLISGCSLGIAALAGATLVEYGLDVNLGIDELLFVDDERAGATVHPGRLAPQTAIAFLCCGAALLFHGRRVGTRPAELFAVIALFIAVLALTAYVYEAPMLARYPGLTPIAPHTSVLFVVFAVGLVAALRGPLATSLIGPRVGSVMARRLLPVSFVAIPAAGWLRLEGERQGVYGTAEGVALMVLTQLLIIGAGIFLVARALNQADAERERATEVERHMAAIVEASSEAIFGLDCAGVVTSWNRGAERMYGYAPDEIIGRPVSVLAPPGHRDAARELLSSVLDGRRLSHHLATRARKDGSLIDVAITAAPIVADGRVTGISAISQDVTAENEIKRELEDRVRERTAALAHSRAETLQRLALAAEYRDDDTYRHTERVGLLSALLARRVDLPDAEVSLLRQAAPLHDIGKLALPDALLLKHGRFSEDEFEAMKRHTVLGARILENSGSAVLQMAERIALTHHERWDGRGYPAGLQGDDIPMIGRIVAVADVFDALTHERPYKPAWSVQEALDEIVRSSGTHFDPRVVDALTAVDIERYLASEAESARRSGDEPDGRSTASYASDDGPLPGRPLSV